MLAAPEQNHETARLFLSTLSNDTSARIESIAAPVLLDPGPLGAILGEWPGALPGGLVEVPPGCAVTVRRLSAHQYGLRATQGEAGQPAPPSLAGRRPASLRILAAASR